MTFPDPLSRTMREDVPERRLLAAIMARAVEDLRTGGADEMVAAFVWLTDGRGALALYCEFLDVDPGYLCRKVAAQFGRTVAAARIVLNAKRETPRVETRGGSRHRRKTK